MITRALAARFAKNLSATSTEARCTNRVSGKPSCFAAEMSSANHSRVKIQPRWRRKTINVGCLPSSLPKVWGAPLGDDITMWFQVASGIMSIVACSHETRCGSQPMYAYPRVDPNSSCCPFLTIATL